MGIENLIPLAIKLFNKLGKSKRLKAINTLDKLVESGDVGKIRKLPRKVSDGTRSLVAKGTLKDEVTQVLDDVGFERIDATISGPLGKKYNTEAGKKIIKKTRADSPQSNYKSKKDPGSDRKHTPNMNSPIKRFFNKYLGSDYKEYEQGIRELIEQKLRQIKTKMSKDNVPNYEIIFRESIKTPEAMMKAYPKLLDEILPYRHKAQRFIEEDYHQLSQGPNTKLYRQQVYDYLKSRGKTDKEIKAMFPKSFATVGHDPPAGLSYGDFLTTRNKSSLQNFQQSATPKFWNPEFGVVNVGKDTPDRWILEAMQSGNLSKEGMKQIQAMYKKLGLKSRLRNIDIGMQDLEKQSKFVDYGTLTGNKLFTGPGKSGTEKTKQLFNRMTGQGDISFEEILREVNKRYYSSGGLVKLLNKLKLTKKQRDLIMKTAYSPHRKPVTGPKALREKRIKDKLAKVGATKKWRYVKADDVKPRKRRTKQRPFAAGGIVSLYVR
tara:strand:- start:1080 stop:2552 length:1473 start_codon:yes stop_codon:yes gene_type:complete